MSASLRNPILFEDVFDVVAKDPQGKKFDKGALLCQAAELVPC
jgi:hypothetical protein